jgi:cobalt-zinc-cadmium efflux system protein
VAGRFEDDAWTTPSRTPPYYPDAVTLSPDADAYEVLARVDGSDGCSVKDSWATLDLSIEDFARLVVGEWLWLDPATALLVGVVIAVGTYGLLRESFNAAMDAVPDSVDQAEVNEFLTSQPGVTAVHHLHIWPLGAGEIALTAHLVRPDDLDHDDFIDATTRALDHRFGINHATLQIERGKACEHDLHDAAPHHSH